MRVDTFIPVVTFLALAGTSNAAPLKDAESSLEKRWCLFGIIGTSCGHTTSSAVTTSSAAATSTSKATSSAVQSSAVSSAKSTATSATSTTSASWSQCTSFDWTPFSTGWSWGGGFSVDYVKAWYLDVYGLSPPPFMNWHQVSALVSQFGTKTVASGAKATSVYKHGCSNPWTAAAVQATSTAKVTTTTAATSTSKAASSSSSSSAASASKTSSVVVATSAASSSSAKSSSSSIVAASSAAVTSSASAAATASAAKSSASSVSVAVASSASSAPAVSSAVASSSAASSAPASSSGAASAVVVSASSAAAASSSSASSSAAGDSSTTVIAQAVTTTAADVTTVTSSTTPVAVNVTTSTSSSASAATSSAVTINGYVSQGCYQEVSGRLLSSVQTSDAAMTIDECTSICGNYGFQVAGVEYGNECYCGSISALSSAAVSGECKMACAGDSTEICGGPNAINAYYNPSIVAATINLPTGWTTYGVVNEGTDGRALTYTVGSSSTNTVESCAASCAALGYTVSGTEYSAECYCGMGFSNGGGVLQDASAAFMTCSGNLAESCGGPSILSVVTSLVGTIPSI